MTTETSQDVQEYKVFVGNIAYSTDIETLKETFASAGTVTDARIVKKFGRSQGFAFIAFETETEAENAVKSLNNVELGGRQLNVERALPPKPKDPDAPAVKKTRKAPVPKQDKKTSESSEPVAPETESKPKRKPRRKAPKEKKPVEKDAEPVADKPTEPVVEGEFSQTTIFVGNLPYKVGDVDLGHIFQDYKVKSASIALNHYNRPKGYGFVEFESAAEMAKVLAEVKGATCDGRSLLIRAAKNEVALAKSNSKKPRKRRSSKPKKSVNPTVEGEEGATVVSTAVVEGEEGF